MARWALTVVLVCMCEGARAADADTTRVILDRGTFGASARVLGAIADKVSVEVDRLIPGRVAEYPAGGILCYVGSGETPVTLVGVRQAGEPEAVKPGSLRIVVGRRVRPSNFAEFVFELSHELAHAKMDARYDNYLVETFAVAVSLKVMGDVGSLPARQANIAQYTSALPAKVQMALENQDWAAARAYWQSQIPKQGREFRDGYSLAFLGALILDAAGQPEWRELLNAAEIGDECTPSEHFQMCRPAAEKMGRLAGALRALGY